MEASSALLTMFYERIFAWLRRLCWGDEDAADLTQRTFCKAWASLASYQGRSTFSSWLHGIAHHTYVDWRRQQGRTRPQADSWWESVAAPASSPFENAAEADSIRRLYTLVDQLDLGVRETIHLHYYQGLSLQETANALGIATSTVKYRLREALGQLRRILRGETPDDL
jgi:RNA polymerase sigma-70 factor (ECF subfamily)